MTSRRSPILALLGAVALGLAAAAAAPAADAAGEKPAQRITAQLVNPGSIRPRLDTRPVTVWIERYTTESEAERFDALLRQKGARAFENALAEDAVGRLQVGDRLSYSIGFAWRTEDDSGEHLVLIAQRPIDFREIFSGSRSRNYPFTVVQLDLDAEGEGTGEIVLAGKISATKNGQVEILDLDFSTARLLQVRRHEG